jgi:hypothetical protein
MGRQTIAYGVTNYTQVVAPVVGVRYWFSELVGLDVGLGMSLAGGKTKATGVDDVKAAGHTAALLHAGVPLSLADSGHFSFQVVPEANIGFAVTGDQDADPDDEFKSSGTFFNVGGKVGGEVHFGFMGIPELSLQGNVGVYLQMESVKDKQTVADVDAEVSQSATTFGTTLGSDPWDIFTSNISALYYF